jgi:hypothetical protein
MIKLYETIILCFVLYGCETLSLTQWGQHRFRVFGYRILTRTFGPKREELAGGWRKLHNEELYNLYAFPNNIRVRKWRMRWAGHVARMGDMRNVLFWLENVQGRELGRSRQRWENYSRMDLRETVGSCRLDSSVSG